MRRRDFLASGAIALVSPLSARAQTRRPTIGILSVDTIKPSAWLQFPGIGIRIPQSILVRADKVIE
jgi:hypothetical protein